MVIVTNIYKTARSERMQWYWLPRLAVTGLGSRIEWLKWWFEFYPAWHGVALYLVLAVGMSLGLSLATVAGIMKLWY